MNPKNIRAGFSLVELAVATSILGLVLAIPILLLRSTEQLQRTRTAQAELESMARRTLDRLAERLETSGTAVIPQWGGGPGVGTSLVDLQPATGWAAGATVWGPLERIQLADDPADPDDGVDNDSDGTIDEKRVLWITDVGLPTQRILVLCGSVRDSLAGEQPANGLDDNGNGLIDEAGLVFAFDADSVTVRITLEKRDASGQVVSHTAQRNVAFRN